MGLFTKSSSPKKKTEPDTKENNNNKSSSSRSSPRKSPTKSAAKSSTHSPTKSVREKEQTYKKGSWSRSTKGTRYSSDIHPLNLPPEERERRRSAMSSDSEQDEEMYRMDVDSDTSGTNQHLNGADDEQMNGDSSPIPPPHQTPSPPPKPAYDPEVCKATGNKYFKAKDYTRAAQEYTKGEELPPSPWSLPCFMYKCG